MATTNPLGNDDNPNLAAEESLLAIYSFTQLGLKYPCSPFVRRNLESNAIPMVPEVFKPFTNPRLIPNIENTGPKESLVILGKYLGCTSYEFNMAEFWFLDTLAMLLMKAQRADPPMSPDHQLVLIAWFCEFVKELQTFDAATQKQMFDRFKESMLKCGNFIYDEKGCPNPPQPKEVGVSYLVPNPPVDVRATSSPYKNRSATALQDAMDVNLKSILIMIDLIMEVFANEFKYKLVRNFLTSAPEYQTVPIPYSFNKPKKFLANIPKGTHRKSKIYPAKSKGQIQNQSKNAEYFHLMKVMEMEQLELQRREEEYKEQQNLKDSILPLTLAVDENYYQEIWPPNNSEKVKPVKSKKKGKHK